MAMSRAALPHAGLAGAAPQHQRRRAAPVVAAAAQPYVGSLVGTGLKVGVVVARFNDLVTKPLLEGALEAFQRHGVAAADVDVSSPSPLGRAGAQPQPAHCAGCERSRIVWHSRPAAAPPWGGRLRWAGDEVEGRAAGAAAAGRAATRP